MVKKRSRHGAQKHHNHQSQNTMSNCPPPPTFPAAPGTAKIAFQPPPPAQPPPPPPRYPPPPSTNNNNSGSSFRPPAGDFTFRVAMPESIRVAQQQQQHQQQQQQTDSYRPNGQRSRRDNNRRDGRRGHVAGGRDRKGDAQGDHGRRAQQVEAQRRWQPYRASDRELLHARNDDTELDFADDGPGVMYRDFKEFSDSDDEIHMDLCDSDTERSNADGVIHQPKSTSHDHNVSHPHDSQSKPSANDETTNKIGHNDDDHSDDDTEGNEDDGPPRKRTRLQTALPGDSSTAPKWSNPDPYTVLPPSNEPRRCLDMVQLIRKARIEASATTKKKGEEPAEFISFDDITPNMAVSGSLGSADDVKPQSHHTDTVNGPYPGESSPSLQQPHNNLSRKRSFRQIDSSPALDSHNNSANKRAASPLQSKPVGEDGTLLPSARSAAHKPTRSDKPERPRRRGTSPKVKNKSMATVDTRGSQTPWVKEHQARCSASILNNEVKDLYEYLKPTPNDHLVRSKLVSRLEQILCSRFPGSTLHSFGSFVTGLYLPSGDIDLVLLSKGFLTGYGQPFVAKRMAWTVANLIERSSIAVPGSVQPIAHAKVPLTKFVDATTGIEVDISFDNYSGVEALDRIKKWLATYPDLAPLVLIIKHYLALNSRNMPANGGLGGYSVICMVVSMLQHNPAVQAGCSGHLGELLVKFFRFYGRDFNFLNLVIFTNPAGYKLKTEVAELEERDLQKICIMDPNNNIRNVSSSAFNSPHIVSEFCEAYETLTKRLLEVAIDIANEIKPEETPIILGCLFRGDYSSWEEQRKRFRRLLDSAQHSYSNAVRKGLQM